MQSLYDAGVLSGLEYMLAEGQTLRTFDLSTSLGHLTLVNGAWGAGYMRGVSLGADVRRQRASDTIALRERARS